ncbi:nuclear transport factor 2 family protein [Rhodococcus opacus]|uniref:nuclear transport factor 2 family protein n=1 Tax=Rhodococcus opacus TaxID=37919 RepID=UPI001C454B43|nr:nuclear transport factor 2 family protein [Rhodococcus opacus]MBV6760238.1 nuclear transport factor 2 family protein [Rhodococcus opacus]
MGTVTPADFEEIRAVKARYFRYVDTKNWDALGTLYTPDATFDGFAFDTSTPQAFVQNVAAFLDGVQSVHQGFMPEFDERGPNHVRGIWTMHDYLRWAPGTRGYKGVVLPDQCGIDGYGHYEDEYTRLDGRWLISFQRLTRLRVDPVVPVPGEDDTEYDVTRLTPGWLD